MSEESAMLRIRAIQVEHGDSLLVSYGDALKPRHLLIDGGPASTFPTVLGELDRARTDGKLRLEALVITHYDLDHIKGAIELLGKQPPWLEIADVWFNGHHHLRPTDLLGATDADELTQLIRRRPLPWNAKFPKSRKGEEGGPVVQSVEGFSLPGDLLVNVLSPDALGLSTLASEWIEPNLPPVDAAAGPGDLLGRSDKWPPDAFSHDRTLRFRRDPSLANQSSIALLLTFDDKRVLLAADACADVVLAGLDKHLPSGERIDLLKVSHHGSGRNTDMALLERLRCRTFLISTSGLIHKHPDHALIERLLAAQNHPEIVFNYRQGWPGNWDKKPAGWPSYRARYPENADRFVDVLL